MVSRAFLKSRYRMLPNRQTLVLTPQNPTAAAITVTDCVRRPLKFREVQALGVGISTESKATAFLLPVATLGGNEPERGWLLTDADGGDWVIQMIDWELESTMYRVACTEQAVDA